MTGAVILGVLAAVVVLIPPWIQAHLPFVFAPVLILGVAAVAMLLQRFILDRRAGSRSYDGLADLFIHIHSPFPQDSPLRWVMRGCISFLLTICGGGVGSEGAAIEWGQAFAIRSRSRMSRWFEQRRRTDASTVISAGVAAAFASPFAAVLLPLEMGVGGRHILSVISALSAFLTGKYLSSWVGFHFPSIAGAFYDVDLVSLPAFLSAAVSAAVIGVAAGILGSGLIRTFRYTQESLLDLFQTQTWMRILASGVLLFMVVLTFRSGHAPYLTLLEQVMSNQRGLSETWFLLVSRSLSLAIILAGFGSLGIFSPLLVLGVFFGHALSLSLLHGLGGASIAGLAGGAAFFGVILGAPISASVLAYEMTGNLNVMVPCLIAGLLAERVRQLLKTDTLFEYDLAARGMALIQGRSASVLEAVSVRDAMVTDHEVIHEQEPVSAIYARLIRSRYPFLPVVNSKNIYVGLLTVDVIQAAWTAQSDTSNSPLAGLLEAKDLLYRSGVKPPAVRVNDRLSATQGVFDLIPCVPVLSDDHRVVGLLFVHGVRLAYEREVARRSLAIESERLK
ncbi:chloride channel protein [Bdellovibrionota bacterium FG-1]